MDMHGTFKMSALYSLKGLQRESASKHPLSRATSMPSQSWAAEETNSNFPQDGNASALTNSNLFQVQAAFFTFSSVFFTMNSLSFTKAQILCNFGLAAQAARGKYWELPSFTRGPLGVNMHREENNNKPFFTIRFLDSPGASIYHQNTSLHN